VRRTWIRRVADGELLAEVLTEWVWVRLSDGRPVPVPKELIDLAAEVTKATLDRQRRLLPPRLSPLRGGRVPGTVGEGRGFI